MGLTVARPPREVEIFAEDAEAQNVLAETQLAAHVRDCWERAKFAKQPIQDRLLRCERQRRGVYDPEKAIEISKTGGSDIYMMLTDIKCHAAASWIRDVMLNTNSRQFDLEPSREPEIPPEVQAGIVDMVKQEAEAFVQAGAQLHPEAFRTRLEAVHDQVMMKLRDEAKDSARRMGNKIEDQLEQGNFRQALRDFIDDYVTYPVAVMKGPTVKRRKRLVWGQGFEAVVMTDLVREFERVSPFDIYPSPNSSGPQDGYLIHRQRISRKKLTEFRGAPGYNTDAIDQVLERFGEKGLRNWLMGDQERDNLEGKPHSRMYSDGIIEALEFWGTVSGQMLLDWGVEDELDPNNEYEANVWLIGPYVIRAIINPDPLGRRPYDIAQWREIPGAFYGMALPETMRDLQSMCNAAARSLSNNMSVASGPQVDIAIDRLPDGEDITSMYPWKIWQTTSDRTGGGAPAIRFFQPEMKAGELMSIYAAFSKQADEITGIPNYVYGNTNVSGAGRTASGLSMLMDNAAKGIKGAVAAIDQVVAAVVNRLYTHNMMYDPDIWVKGDFRVVAKGALGIVAKEQLQIRRNEFLQATANPVDLQIIGVEGRAYLLRELAHTLQMDTDKIVPDIEVVKFRNEQAQMEQAQAAMLQQQQPQQDVPAEPMPEELPPQPME